MHQTVRLGDGDHAEAIDREIEVVREALGRSSKLRDLFDYLIERSRSGTPPREIEIAQDVFGRTAQNGDDGGARVYIHRLRKRLEEIYAERADADVRLTLPLGEYRLVVEVGPVETAAVAAPRRSQWQSIAIGVFAGVMLSLLVFAIVRLWPGPEVRRSAVWAPLFANGRDVIIAEGDHYLFAEKRPDGSVARLVRDYRIRSREELDTYLVKHPQDAERYGDVGQGYVPTTVPRAQQYLAPVLSGAPSVRVLPASQISAAAMLSQNIVYLGLTSGLGPLRAPVGAGARFQPGSEADTIRDTRTGRVFGAGRVDGSSPRRQYGLVSLFAGKEGNRYIVLAGTSEMGLVGLVETLADSKRLTELSDAVENGGAAEALYEVDSQGAGVLAVRLLAIGKRDQRRVWMP